MDAASKKERLFILAEPRSGSSWLMETLNSHPEIRLLGEILNQVQYPEIKAFPAGREKDFPEWLEYLEIKLNASPGRKTRYSGCKILLNQLTLIGEDFADCFLNHYRDASFIFLTRGNLVAEQISLQLAHKYDIWHVKKMNQVALKKVTLAPAVLVANLEKSLRRRETVIQALKNRNSSFFSLPYEDLFADPGRALSGIFAFLGLADKKPVFSDEMKSNPFRPHEVIENYREVRAYLERFPAFLKMLIDA